MKLDPDQANFSKQTDGTIPPLYAYGKKRKTKNDRQKDNDQQETKRWWWDSFMNHTCNLDE